VVIIVILRHIQLIFSSYIKTKKVEKCFMGGNEFLFNSRQIGLWVWPANPARNTLVTEAGTGGSSNSSPESRPAIVKRALARASKPH
jgi:hypothetical protein